MAKQDVLDAINATIVENGKKGITAQSLNNVLNMIVENAGEGGSGDGVLRIMMPDVLMGLCAAFIEFGEFSLASWEQVKEAYAESPIDITVFDEVFGRCFAHNAEVYKSILSKLESQEGTFAILDMSLSMSTSYKIMADYEMAGAIEKVNVSMAQLAICEGMQMYPAEGYEDMFGEMAEPTILLVRLGDESEEMGYPSKVAMRLMSDGSILFDTEMVDEYEFYIPESNSVVLTSEQKTANKRFEDYGKNSSFSWDNVTVFFVSSSGIANEYERVNFVSYNRNSNRPYYCYFKDNELKKAFLEEDDGSVTLETLGTLTTSTTE